MFQKVRNIAILVTVYLATRLPFMVARPVYYDSFEYVRAIKNISWPQLLPVIQSSHQPVHTLYIGLAGIVTIISHVPPPTAYAILSIVFGLVAVLLWYQFLCLFYRQTSAAIWGTLIFTLLPGFWRVSTNILYESLLLACQAGCLMAFFRFQASGRWRHGIAAIVWFVCGELTFIGNVFLLLPIAVLGFMRQKNIHAKLFLWCAIVLMSALGLDFLLSGSWSLFLQKYTVHATDVVSASGGIVLMLGRIARNIMYISSELVHPIVLAAAAIALVLFRKEKQLIVFTLALLASAWVLMQYWHAGFYGRIGILVVFPISLVLGKLCSKKHILGVLIFTLLALNIVVLGVKQRQTPYIAALGLWARSTASQNPAALFITGDATRFAYETFSANVFVIGDPMHDLPSLQKNITKTLQKGSRVFFDASVFTYPYWQPDGWDYQLVSQQPKQGYLSTRLAAGCTLSVAGKMNSNPPFTAYEVVSCRGMQ